jgi:hypothetical protein
LAFSGLSFFRPKRSDGGGSEEFSEFFPQPLLQRRDLAGEGVDI